jgi:hypothetical protein
VERGQHRAGAAAPLPFFFCHAENPALEELLQEDDFAESDGERETESSLSPSPV